PVVGEGPGAVPRRESMIVGPVGPLSIDVSLRQAGEAGRRPDAPFLHQQALETGPPGVISARHRQGGAEHPKVAERTKVVTGRFGLGNRSKNWSPLHRPVGDLL